MGRQRFSRRRQVVSPEAEDEVPLVAQKRTKITGKTETLQSKKRVRFAGEEEGDKEAEQKDKQEGEPEGEQEGEQEGAQTESDQEAEQEGEQEGEQKGDQEDDQNERCLPCVPLIVCCV